MRFAPTKFYDNCDDCPLLPEERWDLYQQNLQKESLAIIEERKQVCLQMESMLVLSSF